MIVGFTGTRRGMSRDQQVRVFSLLKRFDPRYVRHGDCIGADEQFHEMCFAIGIPVHIHPPSNDTYRAFCDTGIITRYNPEDYHVRNRHIVQGSTFMIGAPLGGDARGGTWSTMRYGTRTHKQVYRVERDGRVKLMVGKEEFPWGEDQINV